MVVVAMFMTYLVFREMQVLGTVHHIPQMEYGLRVCHSLFHTKYLLQSVQHPDPIVGRPKKNSPYYYTYIKTNGHIRRISCVVGSRN